MALNPYERLSWRGVVANRRTIEMLEITELRGLGSLTPLRIPQGSYTSGVSASGGTHSGGGALDISVRGLSAAERDRVVRELRETSFAAWYRPFLPGQWPAHIHAIAIGDKELSDQAAWQVSEYRAGRNGLANQGPDNGPDVPIHVYRQDIDMSYYGPENWNNDDWRRFRAYVHGNAAGTVDRGVPYQDLTNGAEASPQALIEYTNARTKEAKDDLAAIKSDLSAIKTKLGI
jgi:hypothetical protein